MTQRATEDLHVVPSQINVILQYIIISANNSSNNIKKVLAYFQESKLQKALWANFEKIENFRQCILK